MTIKKFTMKDIDEEIMQIVQQQQTGGQAGASGPPSIIKSLMDRAKSIRTGTNANNNQTV